MVTQVAKVCELDEEFLKCKAEFSDRFIYSNYFIPLLITFEDSEVPILPEYKKTWLWRELSYLPDPFKILHSLRELGLEDLLSRNKIPQIDSSPGPEVGPRPGPGPDIGPRIGRTPNRQPRHEVEIELGKTIFSDKEKWVEGSVRDTEDIITTIESKLPEGDRPVLELVRRRVREVHAVVGEMRGLYNSLAGAALSVSERMAANGYGVSALPVRAAFVVTPDSGQAQAIDFFLNLLRSEIGYLFLDRTRIRPKGFAIGEHVFTLSLAPGEEVVLEQKTFSKRLVTFEEQSEQEKTFDLELSSTLSTEIQEGFERQKGLTDAWGLSLSHTGQYSSPENLPWGQINASHTIGFTKNVTEAHNETGRRSTKDSETASSKVAAKYRASHKTTFKVSTEAGFESASKRVVKNPNKYTPVQLHYFKVLQLLEMTQERYGVRLCWTPCVKDPAFDFFERIKKGRSNITQKALESLPDRPVEPQPTPPAENKVPVVEKKWFWSDRTEADKWGMTGDMRADYNLDVDLKDGYAWDGDVDAVRNSLLLETARTNASAEVRGTPVERVNDQGRNVLRVTVHVGAPSWIGGPKIILQIGAQGIKTQTVTEKINEDTKYKDDLAAYRTRSKEYDDKRTQAQEQAKKDADSWEQEMEKKVNPLAEMMGRVIREHFPSAVRDECWEIDLWQKLFEWDRATYVLYPSWWSDLPPRDPTKVPTDFFNASWAKMYLPVRIGMEHLALRWIFGKVIEAKLSKEVEDKITKIIEGDQNTPGLRKFREDSFGPAETNIEADGNRELKGKSQRLAHWTDVMPTDGTHIEVIQSMTSTVDQHTDQDLKDTAGLRKAVLDNEQRDLELKSKAHSMMTQPASIQVVVQTDAQREGT